MTQVETAMRLAFEQAFAKSFTLPMKPMTSLVKGALRRKVGLMTRKTMWSIQRGNR
jgi:hypothetical protein